VATWRLNSVRSCKWTTYSINATEIKTLLICSSTRTSSSRILFLIMSSLGPSLQPEFQFGTGARFSKAPKTFRIGKAMRKSRTLRLQSCFIHIFLNMNIGSLHTRSFRRIHFGLNLVSGKVRPMYTQVFTRPSLGGVVSHCPHNCLLEQHKMTPKSIASCPLSRLGQHSFRSFKR